jgi:hypothetical protein
LNNIQLIVKEELSGNNAWQHANFITQFLRQVGSSGNQKTISYSRERLNEYNLDKVYEIKYPSKENGTEDLKFYGWDVRDASLEIVYPIQKKITSYSEAPTCIGHWSIPTHPEGIVAELVDVGKGVEESDYQGIEVQGKIVLARGEGNIPGNRRAFQLAIEKFGGIGLITDTLLYERSLPGDDNIGNRVRENHPNAISLLRACSREGSGWAFSISHSQGEYLRSLLREGPVKLKAFIDAKIFPGEGEELVGEIKGTEKPEQEIWFVAHSTGAKPGGNCAGGVGLWIENARVIMSLVNQGKISRPKRTIKFLLGAEGGGINAFLKTYSGDVKNVLAAFVYCSVGNDQSKCNSSLILYKSAESIPSFINDLIIDTIEKMSKDGLPQFKDEDRDIKLIRFNVLPYTPWSDNSRLMRLMIPSPLFMSWPSKYFHTQFFTADKLDPAVLKRCGEITTSVALTIANAGIEEARYLVNMIESKGETRLMNVTVQTYNDLLDLFYVNNKESKSKENTIENIEEIINHRKGEINYLTEVSLEAMDSVKDLVKNSLFYKEVDLLKKGLENKNKLELDKIENFRAIFSKEV